jgi:hypothetical protein
MFDPCFGISVAIEYCDVNDLVIKTAQKLQQILLPVGFDNACNPSSLQRVNPMGDRCNHRATNRRGLWGFVHFQRNTLGNIENGFSRFHTVAWNLSLDVPAFEVEHILL